MPSKVTSADVKRSLSGDRIFRYNRNHQMMARGGLLDVSPGISVREFKAQKIIKGRNEARGPSSYIVLVYVGEGDPRGRRKSSDRLTSMKDVVAFINQHAAQAASAVAAEESVIDRPRMEMLAE